MDEKFPTRWKPGQSGNVHGRPAGSGKVAKLREQIDQHVPAIISRLAQQALEGDTSAARLLLERVVPPLRSTEIEVPISLPDGSLAAQGQAIIAAVGNGEVSPGAASAIIAALAGLGRIRESDELAVRVAALEARK